MTQTITPSRPAAPAMVDGFIEHLHSLRDGTGFRFTRDGRRTLMCDCFGILAAELFGDLVAIPEGYVPLGRALQARQCTDGFWRDEQLHPSDIRGAMTERYVRWQQSYFALHALDALGLSPRRRLAFLDDFCSPARAVDWLRERNYKNFWFASNEIMWLMSFLAWTAEQGDERALRVMDAILDELDRTQDPETGYWGTDRGATLFNGMAGAFHVYSFYFWRNRRVRYVDAIIDNTLSLQHRDGMWEARGGGGACHDLDAVDILVKFSLISDHRASEVADALDRAWNGLLTTRNPDGGFCERRWAPPRSWKRRLGEALGLDKLLNRPNPRTPPEYTYSGWSAMACPVTDSNLWAAWFRPLTLALIAARYPGRYPVVNLGPFRRLPALGWHHENLVAAAGRGEGAV